MRVSIRIAACALVLCAGSGAGQAPSQTPAQTVDDTVARLLATPRFYRISASGGMKAEDGYRMCFGGDMLRKMFRISSDLSKDPQALSALNKGCTLKTVRDGQSVSVTRECDRAKGAQITTRLRLSGTLKEFHEHSEMTLPRFGPEGSDETITSDEAMIYLGACPAKMKPGQLIGPDGAVVDPIADAARMAAEAKDAADDAELRAAVTPH